MKSVFRKTQMWKMLCSPREQSSKFPTRMMIATRENENEIFLHSLTTIFVIAFRLHLVLMFLMHKTCFLACFHTVLATPIHVYSSLVKCKSVTSTREYRKQNPMFTSQRTQHFMWSTWHNIVKMSAESTSGLVLTVKIKGKINKWICQYKGH